MWGDGAGDGGAEGLDEVDRGARGGVLEDDKQAREGGVQLDQVRMERGLGVEDVDVLFLRRFLSRCEPVRCEWGEKETNGRGV